MRYDWRSGIADLGPFDKGMCNKTNARSLPEGTVRNAVNVDFVKLGSGEEIRSREGFTKSIAAINPRGGFSCPAGMYFVEGQKIKKFTPPSTTSILFSGIAGTEFAWEYNNEIVYFSDGILSLKLIDDVAYRWGMPIPSAPTISGTSGTYGEGIYSAAICFVDANGLESGASEITTATFGPDTGIVFTDLPVPSDPQVSALRLYLSMPNGSELYHVADISLALNSYTITSGRYDNSNTLETKFVSPAPAGRVIKFYKGRAYISDEYGNTFYSDPFEYDHFRLGSNFFLTPSAVDIVATVTDGMFIAYGDVTKYYQGEVEDGFNISHVADYGGIRGTEKRIPKSDSIYWQSQRGTCKGSPGGAFENIVEDIVATHSGTSGGAIIKETNGVRQYITSIKNPTVSPMAASSFIELEVIRKGE